MFLNINGFLIDDSEDDSLKYDLDISPEHEQSIIELLGCENIDDIPDGEILLTQEQIEKIVSITKEAIPLGLDIFIGVRA